MENFLNEIQLIAFMQQSASNYKGSTQAGTQVLSYLLNHYIPEPGKSISSTAKGELIKQLGMDVTQISDLIKRIDEKISILSAIGTGKPISSELVNALISEELRNYNAELNVEKEQKTKMFKISAEKVDQIMGIGINENSNQDRNPESCHTWIADEIMEQYAMSQLSPKERQYHLTGRIHIHMLRYWDRPFCQEWDLRLVLLNGIPPTNWGSTAHSGPAKSPVVAVTHAAKWLAIAQGEFSGGQGYDNFCTLLSPYLVGLSYEDIKQVAQCFVFESNQVFAARGGQAPFTSISCEPCIAEELEDVDAICPGGKLKGTYKDFEKEARLFFRALVDTYANGDVDHRPFAFPKHEIKVTKKGLANAKDEYKYCVEKEAVTMGSPYFLNCIAPWLPEHIHSQCCRLIISSSEIKKVCHSDPEIFNQKTHYSNLGSLQSISINLPRCAYLSKKNGTSIYNEIEDVAIVIKAILMKKFANIRDELKKQHSRLPFSSGIVEKSHLESQQMLDLRKQSLSVGFVGLNEAVRSLTDGKSELHNPEGYEIGRKILLHIQDLCLKWSKENGIKFSMWEQPAESTANRFALSDMKYFPDLASKCVLGTGKSVYYTNSSHLRYDAPISIWERIEKQGNLHPIVQGGVITHIWLGEKSPHPDALWELTKLICEKTNTAYFSYTFDYSYCIKCRKTVKGIIDECSCGGKENDIEWYSRITGYYSRVKRWNEGKLAEFKDRLRYNEESIVRTLSNKELEVNKNKEKNPVGFKIVRADKIF